MSNDGDIYKLIKSFSRDYDAFHAARLRLQERLTELDHDPVHKERFVTWAAFQAAWNSLVMCETGCRGLIEDLRSNLESKGEVIPLRAVENKDE
jgi:hypothetical protein